jgi:hypothetical protein
MYWVLQILVRRLLLFWRRQKLFDRSYSVVKVLARSIVLLRSNSIAQKRSSFPKKPSLRGSAATEAISGQQGGDCFAERSRSQGQFLKSVLESPRSWEGTALLESDELSKTASATRAPSPGQWRKSGKLIQFWHN